jgi:hypothetical protein
MSLVIERKQRNPLRKQELWGQGNLDILNPHYRELYNDVIINSDYDDLSDIDQRVKRKYENLLKSSEDLANRYLDSAFLRYIERVKKPKAADYKRIYQYQGVEVLLDEANVSDTNYAPGSKNYRDIQHSVLVMLTYVRDLIPNKKPRIVITDVYKNKHVRDVAYSTPFRPAGFAFNKYIFIDENSKDEAAIYVHELAHWIVDLIPTQTQPLLIKAFNDMLDYYYKLSKKKRIQSSEITDSMRTRMAKKLGFDEYGLTNPDEFFAVLIENWKMLPNNKITYKFKSTVKSILIRI